MIAAIAVLALCAAAVPAGAEGIAVSSYVAAALGSSPEVRSAEEAWKAADADLKGQTAAMLLPTLAFDYTQYPYGHNPLDAYGYGRGRFAARQGQAVTTANWNLFNGFQDLEKTRAAAAARRAAAHALKAARQDRAFAAIAAFYGLDSKAELLEVARQNLKDQKRQYDQSLDLYQHGMKSLADLLKSETDWRSSQLRLIAAEADRRGALVEINVLVDRGPAEEAELAINLQAGATELPRVSEDLARSLEQRPEVARARDNVEKTRVAAQQALQGALPTVKVDATWTRTRYAAFPGAASAIANPRESVGVALSLPLGFNGFSQGWAVAAASAERRRAEAARRETERTVQSEVYGAFIGLEKVSRSYEVALKKEEIAAKALELVGRQYRQGAADAVGMNQAQNDYLNARVERALALHDIFINRARYRRAVGDPLW
ncbi:MAG: TolC family protein [Elusimicrobia bacterium]|nr:TolC family protein [Elusimicrobiota bacterium]